MIKLVSRRLSSIINIFDRWKAEVVLVCIAVADLERGSMAGAKMEHVMPNPINL